MGLVPLSFASAAWTVLGGEPAELPVDVEVRPGLHLPATLDVAGLVRDGVAVGVAAVHVVMAARGLRAAPPRVVLDGARLTTSVQSERHFRWDGEAQSAWAPLSGFWEAADGWVRTHGNYPHHAERLRSLLGLGADAGADDVAAAVRTRSALDLEEEAAAIGAVLVAVRPAEAWRAHPQAVAAAQQRLLRVREVGAAPARPWGQGRLPLSGVRVLDLTRVIAGPIATRDLAFAGAQVLRVDGPGLPEIEWQHLDSGQGKRSTLLDLSSRAGRAALEELLAQADVVVTGYRPASLDRHGLGAETLGERHPGLVTASVSAWGTTGPWGERRGFDSIVQAASGIALAESPRPGVPGALPAQALDHTAGHLLAAGVALALVRQRREGGSRHVETSLARVAQELLAAPAVTPPDDARPPTLQTGRSGAGETTVALPVLTYDGAPDGYPALSRPWGRDDPHW